MIQGENGMATKAPVKLRKPAVVEEEELEDDDEELDDEEEEVVVKPTKRATTKAPVKERPSERAMREAKTATKGKPVAVASNNSARFYVEQVLLAGAPADEVKKRAMAAAKKDGSDASFKTFNVPYFINLLVEKRNYRKIEKNGTVKLVAPRA